MKLLLFLLFFPAITYSQKSPKAYKYFGITGFSGKSYGSRGGLVFGAGIIANNNITVGGGIDAFVFSNDRFAQGYLDLKIFFAGLDKVSSLLLSIEPGYILYNKTSRYGIHSNGSFAGDALIGVVRRLNGKKSAIFAEIGYSNISFKTKNADSTIINRYGGGKVAVGLFF